MSLILFIEPENLILPLTSSFSVGFSVFIPTLPPFKILNTIPSILLVEIIVFVVSFCSILNAGPIAFCVIISIFDATEVSVDVVSCVPLTVKFITAS